MKDRTLTLKSKEALDLPARQHVVVGHTSANGQKRTCRGHLAISAIQG
jgi:hypothetical protein